MTGPRARVAVPARRRPSSPHGRAPARASRRLPARAARPARPAALDRTLALALAGVGLLAVVLGVLVVQGRLLLHPCVSADGPLGQLGVRLALLTSATDCPEGTLAVSDAATHGAILVLSVAAPVLVAHVLVAVFGAGLTALLVRAASSAGALLGAVLVRLPVRPRVVSTPPRRLVVVGDPDVRPPGSRGLRLHPHRGPPLARA
ncbi:hypothetical protein [Cellulomonas cellasea]|uniref:Uncharacterized protein n=1 Tax=Cellulomonas cellasea TaxID=43670 RepID=A0A7W4UJL0_9CELL|nr:hypothetical protein [Cellulomonas cellasea]MBB2925366.1 hypothetical protein [Cellulomonas cellasea]